MANVIPKEVKKEIIDGYIAETWKAVLLTSAFVYATGTYVTYNDLLISGTEVVGTGYTAGGAAVTKSAWGAGSGYTGTTNAMLDASNVAWTSATFAEVRYVAVYETTGGKIRAIYDFGANESVTSGTFIVEWNASGLTKIS